MFRFHIFERIIFSKTVNMKYQFASVDGRKLTELTILLSLSPNQMKSQSYFKIAMVVTATIT